MKSPLHYSILCLCFCFSINTWSFQNLQDSFGLELKTTNKKIEPDYTRNGVKIDNSGNLVYTDNTGIDDDVKIVIDGVNYRLSNANMVLTAGSGTRQDGNDVLVPIASVTGEIRINTKAGDDTFTVDLSNGNFRIPIQYNGGSQNTTLGDDMVLMGGNNDYDTVEHTFINNNDGYIDVSENNTINYTGLEPITDNLSASNRIFTFTNNNYTESFLDASGSLDNRIDSNQSESVDFNNPTNSLTINATNSAQNRMRIRGLDASFNANLIVNGEDTNDEVRFENNHTDIGNGHLNLNVNAVFILENTTAASVTSNSGDLTFIGPGATLLSNGGNISMAAGTVIPNIFGGSTELGRIQHFGHIQATGAGQITLDGTTFGPNNSAPLVGIRLAGNASIISDAGNINLIGKGIEGGFNAHFRGIEIDGSSIIQSTSGDISLNGTGRNVASDFNVGVAIGSGTIQGLTGPSDIVVIGTGYKGVQIDSGALNTINPGDILLLGTSTSADSPAINITSSITLVQSANILTLTANTGPIHTPNGVAAQAIFDAANTTINGILAPGQSPGQVIMNGNINMDAGDTLEIEFESTFTPGSDYDQLKVNGAVNISGATFNLIDNANPVLNGEYVIIDNDGTDPISGTFNGLPEGASISGNGRTWNIHYNYNGSNDVVLIPSVPDVNVIVDNSGNLILQIHLMRMIT